jgi:hypothetical protein
MKHTITNAGPGAQNVSLDYTDEGVNLIIDRTVTGLPADAETYVPAFDQDVRANFSHMFPPPVYPESEMEVYE